MSNVEYICFLNSKKKKEIVLDFKKCINLAVDYTLLLQDEADAGNIKECLQLIFGRFKNDYEIVKVRYK